MNRKKNNPVRLEKVEEENIVDLLNKDIMFKVKFYFLFILIIILCVAICFAVQPQTYGFINW